MHQTCTGNANAEGHKPFVALLPSTAAGEQGHGHPITSQSRMTTYHDSHAKEQSYAASLRFMLKPVLTLMLSLILLLWRADAPAQSLASEYGTYHTTKAPSCQTVDPNDFDPVQLTSRL